VLDDVQFNARDYQHRAWFAGGDPLQGQWLSLPVHRPFGRATRINEVVLLEREKSARRVAHLTRQYFGTAPRWTAMRLIIDQVSLAIQLGSCLADVGALTTRLLLKDMGWRGTIVHSSAFLVRKERSARLADLTAAVGATEYLCGTGGAKYLDEAPFAELGLSVQYVRLPDVPLLEERRRVSGLWWLAAMKWDEQRELALTLASM
jgi:hypothetical protein